MKRTIAGSLAALAIVGGTAGSRWANEPDSVEAGRKLGSEPVTVVEAGRKWRSGELAATLGNSWT